MERYDEKRSREIHHDGSVPNIKNKFHEKMARRIKVLAIEFEADFHNGVIVVPEEYKGKLAKHIKVIALMDEPLEKETVQYSDEYIEKNWHEMIAQGLSHYDHAYYKSDQYMLDRGREGAEKYA